MNPLRAAIAREPFVVLDGGLASELAARGVDLNDPLWSARALIDNPKAIAEVHRDYFAAGADVATTATYQISAAGLRASGRDPAEVTELFARAIEIARGARAQAGPGAPPRAIIVSLGSYGATCPGGAEYTGAFGAIDRAGLVAFHRMRLSALADAHAHAHAIAFETIPSVREVEAISDALLDAAPPLPVWIAFTCRDPATTGAGDDLAAAIRAASRVRGVIAVGINCSAPALVTAAVPTIRGATDLHVVAYANAGEHYDARCFVGLRCGPTAFAEAAARWIDAGADLVGGCCRTTPAHVSAVALLREGRR